MHRTNKYTPTLWLITTLVTAALSLLATSAQAVDRIETSDGAISGTIEQITRDTVTIDVRGSKQTVDTAEIDLINFDREPADLRRVKNDIRAERYEDSLAALQTLSLPADTPATARADAAYFAAYCQGQLALAGGATPAATAAVEKFLTEFPQSHLYYPAQRLAGRLALATGDFAGAMEHFRSLAVATSPMLKMEAAVLAGQTQAAAGRQGESLKSFESALAMRAESPAEAALRQSAILGKAVALAHAGQLESAIRGVEQVIASANPEDMTLRAKAYNTLGECYRVAKMPRDALLAYLHVDVVYFADSQLHAEALANLAALWNELDHPDRAAETERLLKTRYPGSRWAKQL